LLSPRASIDLSTRRHNDWRVIEVREPPTRS
jgi:hypothetical protein